MLPVCRLRQHSHPSDPVNYKSFYPQALLCPLNSEDSWSTDCDGTEDKEIHHLPWWKPRPLGPFPTCLKFSTQPDSTPLMESCKLQSPLCSQPLLFPMISGELWSTGCHSTEKAMRGTLKHRLCLHRGNQESGPSETSAAPKDTDSNSMDGPRGKDTARTNWKKRWVGTNGRICLTNYKQQGNTKSQWSCCRKTWSFKHRRSRKRKHF